MVCIGKHLTQTNLRCSHSFHTNDLVVRKCHHECQSTSYQLEVESLFDSNNTIKTSNSISRLSKARLIQAPSASVVLTLSHLPFGDKSDMSPIAHQSLPFARSKAINLRRGFLFPNLSPRPTDHILANSSSWQKPMESPTLSTKRCQLCHPSAIRESLRQKLNGAKGGEVRSQMKKKKQD